MAVAVELLAKFIRDLQTRLPPNDPDQPFLRRMGLLTHARLNLQAERYLSRPLAASIKELNLNLRTHYLLERNNIVRIDQIVALGDNLEDIKLLGPKMTSTINKRVKQFISAKSRSDVERQLVQANLTEVECFISIMPSDRIKMILVRQGATTVDQLCSLTEKELKDMQARQIGVTKEDIVTIEALIKSLSNQA